MQIRSHAKINWSLRVLGKRGDGFHDLETLFQTISLHDTLTIERAERMAIRSSDPTIPSDERNLVWKAARAMQLRCGAPAVTVDIEKRIPAGGGLGGGSSNAAATLRAIDVLFALRTPVDLLSEIALQLGSDVPFFLTGGTAYATGRGEKLVPLGPLAAIPLLLIVSPQRVQTGEAFALLSATPRAPSDPLGLERVRAMVESDLLEYRDLLVNDFEPPVFARLPRLSDLKRRLYDSGAGWAGMTGSGSTMVGAYRTASARDLALSHFPEGTAIAAQTIAPVLPEDVISNRG
jgi:4-diphosphocytidyl-2-C-methyl-D-erythritol kinase